MQNLANICKHFDKKNEIAELCKGVHCVDLGESFQTHIYLQNFISIQPRMSPVKFAGRVRETGLPARGPPLRLREAHLAAPGAPASAVAAQMRQTLEGSFSAVSKRNFARKYAFESSRRDLHNALLCTALKSHFFFEKFVRILSKNAIF